MRLRRSILLGNFAIVVALLLAACGGGAAPKGTATATGPTATPVPQATVAPTPTPASSLKEEERFKIFEGGKVISLDEIKNPKYGGTLQITSGSVPADPNPSNGDGGGQFDQNFAPIWEKLAEWNQFKPSECIPDLAEKWTVDTTGTKYTFNLRPGLKWHDGSALTADDVVASFDYRVWLWKTHKRGPRIGGVQDPMYQSARAIDPLTAEVTLKFPTLSFMPTMCSANFYIFPKKNVDTQINKPGVYVPIVNYKDLPPIGTGPFKYVETRPNEVTKLVKNDSYWRKDPNGKVLPYLDGIQLTWIGDTNVRIGAMRTGQIHFWPTYPNIDARAADELFKALGNKVYGVRGTLSILNGISIQQHPMMKDRDFRWALALIMDTKEYKQRIYEGLIVDGEIIPEGIFPREALSKEERLKSLIYNPDRTQALAEAKRLLAKVGIDVPNFEVVLGCASGSAFRCETMELYAKQLKDFGFKTKIEVAVPGAPVASDAATKQFWNYLTASISVVDASAILQIGILASEATWQTPTGDRAVAAKKLREFYEASFNTTDPQARIKSLQEAQRLLLNEDANVITLGYPAWNNPVYTFVKGLFFYATMSEGAQQRYTWLDK